MKTFTNDEKDLLEQLIDKYGLQCLVNTLQEICLDKAEHLQCNWQDKALAQTWVHDSYKLDITFDGQ